MCVCVGGGGGGGSSRLVFSKLHPCVVFKFL